MAHSALAPNSLLIILYGLVLKTLTSLLTYKSASPYALQTLRHAHRSIKETNNYYSLDPSLCLPSYIHFHVVLCL